MPQYLERLPELKAAVQKILAALPACHDWDHTLRVYENARLINAVENGDPAVVEFAALLHDIGRAEELEDQGKTCHATLGAERASEVLHGLGIRDDAFVKHVCTCVRTHRYRQRDGHKPATLEAEVVYDADKLDSIGAVGIGRAFHFAGRIGARLHNREADALASASYSSEDSAYREFLVKLRHLHERMLTAEGRRLAADRHRYMVAFFAQLEAEIHPQ